MATFFNNTGNIRNDSNNMIGNLSNVCYAFMFAGIAITVIVILIVIGQGSYNKNLLIGTISGYATIITGVLGLICVIMMSMQNKGISRVIVSAYDNIAVIVQFILIIIILAYSVSINSIYFNKISENNVNDSYKWFLFISILLLFSQFIILLNLFQTIYKPVNQAVKNNNNIKIMISLFIALINVSILVTATQSLIFFTTDG